MWPITTRMQVRLLCPQPTHMARFRWREEARGLRSRRQRIDPYRRGGNKRMEIYALSPHAYQKPTLGRIVVAVAQLIERWLVEPEAAGLLPVCHPILPSTLAGIILCLCLIMKMTGTNANAASMLPAAITAWLCTGAKGKAAQRN